MHGINVVKKNVHYKGIILLLIPLSLSAFTHLWNPIGFLDPENDESVYIRRAMHVLQGLGPQESVGSYDHPYFGQLFLAGIFKIIGYPNSLNPSANLHSIEILYTIPRLLIGILAIIDTFLIYKIGRINYNGNLNIAFVSSTLFAVMPIIWWVLRRVWLEPIQLPFLLSSILFAVYYAKNSENTVSSSKNSVLISLSGIFLGLAIFTKIPATAMIPLLGYIIISKRDNNIDNKKYKALGLWFIPVILIPLLWPAYSISIGQFGSWLHDVYGQTHRGSQLFFETIMENFENDMVFMILGICGLVFAAIKRDFFLLLWVIPFLIFLYFIGFVQYFHFIPIFPAFCIAAARLIEYISDKATKKKKIQQTLQFVILLGLGIFGILTLIMTANITDVPFKAEAFVVKYLQKDSLNNINSNNDNTDTTRITVISNPFYLWIPQYVFHLPHYYVNHLSIPGINTSKILFVVDFSFVNTLDNAQYETREKLNKIYNGYNKTTVAEFGNGNPYRNGIKVMSVDLKSALSAKGQKIVNLIDQNHVWKAINDAKVSHGSNDLNILVKTDNANKAFNRAVLQTHVNLTSKPLLLSLDYSSESISGKAIFYTEIKEIGGKIIWGARLHNTSGKTIFDTFVLPKETTNVHGIEISLHIITEQAGQHVLNVKRAIIS